jgi:hypothetical protein
MNDILEVHTSDRQTYKRCRRKFGWGSTLRDNLVRIGPDHKAFFLGTGFHFALEDWFGYRRFEHPALAFAAYYDAQKTEDLPDEAEEVLELATGMLAYYVEDWLEDHPEEFETLVVDSVPQVEVEVAIDITGLLWDSAGHINHPWLQQTLGDGEVHYVTTFDRVVIDQHQRIMGLDYKTAAQFDELNLQTNPQAGAYDWAMDLFYTPVGYKPEGIIWQQHKKVVPEQPKVLIGGHLSTDKRQSTTYRLYKRALREQFDSIPEKYNDILATLGEQQDYWGDRFVRRDLLRRNQTQREVEQGKIIAEVLEMLNPELALYPNPTKDCSWDCPFKAPCLAKDDGSDYEYILSSEYDQWAGYKDDWRSRVKYPEAIEPTDSPSTPTP